MIYEHGQNYFMTPFIILGIVTSKYSLGILFLRLSKVFNPMAFKSFPLSVFSYRTYVNTAGLLSVIFVIQARYMQFLFCMLINTSYFQKVLFKVSYFCYFHLLINELQKVFNLIYGARKMKLKFSQQCNWLIIVSVFKFLILVIMGFWSVRAFQLRFLELI